MLINYHQIIIYFIVKKIIKNMKFKPQGGFEPPTYALPRHRSTPEPLRQIKSLFLNHI